MSRIYETKTVRFTVITSRLIRIEWSETGEFENYSSQVMLDRTQDDCNCHYLHNEKILTLTTKYLHLEYNAIGEKISKKNLKISYNLDDKEFVWKPGKADAHNLKGTTRTLDDTNGEELELEPGLISRDGWVLYDDSDSLVFNDDGWLQKRKNPDNIDWYFFGHGHDYKAALRDFTRVAGKIPIPPKFAFGYWWSRYWNYTDSELRKLVNDFKRFDIPVDVLIIDMDWHKTYGLSKHTKDYAPDGSLVGWTGYTWDNNLFPTRQKLLSDLHLQGLKVALNLHPASGIAPMEACYKAFIDEYDCSDETGYIPFRMADKRWKDTYFKTVIKPLEKDGIDFWWLDWQQYQTSNVLEGLNNTWWLNHIFFTEMEITGKRPILFHRWGGLGNHRYQVGFSGDTRASWESLRYQPYFTATAANVGYGYWSHDLGGHFPNGESTDPELYLRWVQFGVLSPIVRTHSTKAANIERRFWMFPEHYDNFKAAIHLRYELIPYIYLCARVAHETGLSICRPMYYEYPNLDEAYKYKSQYFFGQSIIAAPITDPIDKDTQLIEKEVWLPEGYWYEWTTGRYLRGERVIKHSYSIDEVPMFVKAGAIIPARNMIANSTNTESDIKFKVFPGEEGECLFYDDDGKTTDYLLGRYAKVALKGKRSNNKYTLEINHAVGDYHPKNLHRNVTIEYVNTLPPIHISISTRQKVEIDYIAEELTTRVSFVKDCNVSLYVDAEFPNLDPELLNGHKRLFNRFNKACEKLKYEVAKDDWSGTIPDSVHLFQQTLQRVSYNKERAAIELSKLNEKLEEVYKDLENHPSISTDFLSWFKNFTILQD